MTLPIVFVGYSHKDEVEKDLLLCHLHVLGHAGLIHLWSDDRINAGADWEVEIRKVIDQARVAILLISANFLSSDFILRKEVPKLLERRLSEGLIIFPVIAKDCAWETFGWLKQMNIRPKKELKKSRAVWGDDGAHVDEDLAAIAREIAAIVQPTDDDIDTITSDSKVEQIDNEIDAAASDIEAKQRVQIHIRGDFSSPLDVIKTSMILALAGLLRIPISAIEISKVSKGSIIFDLEIPSDAAQTLRTLLKSNSLPLRLLNFERVIFLKESDEIEEWRIKEDKFAFSQRNHTWKTELSSIEKFSPDLFVGREDVLDELLEWANAPSVARRLRSIAAPPGYGKSWLLSEFCRRLRDRTDLFVIQVPTIDLISRTKIGEWLPGITEDAQKKCEEVSSIDQADSLENIIFHLVKKLTQQCHPKLRPILVVDSLDELSEDQQKILETHLLEVFWLFQDVRIIISFRDENKLLRPNLRRGEKRTLLDSFSLDEGQQQLSKRLKENDEKTTISEEQLWKLLSPYALNIPGLNTILVKRILDNEKADEAGLLTADDVRACWKELIGKKLTEHPDFAKDLEKDLRKMARHFEKSWDLETFAELCDYTEHQAQQRIESMMASDVVIHSHRQRYQIIDGLRELLRLEFRMRFGIEIDSKLSDFQAKLMETPREVQIFLSYARPDRDEVEHLYSKLREVGFKPWMDTQDILPGERWEHSINKAIKKSDFFLACLSPRSVNRRGFILKEISQALDILPEMLVDDIYLIPVRLAKCEPLESLADFQWVNLFEPDGWARLVQAIEVGINRRYGST